MGRLIKANGGQTAALWEQQYSYDRYGNRTNVAATGTAADGSLIPRDGLANVSFDGQSNRITTNGFQYDAAGNQTRALAPDSVMWLKSKYDAANRLVEVKRDDGSTNGVVLQTFAYGATNARLSSTDAAINQTTYYAMAGGMTLAEYTESNGSTNSVWTKSYIYMGGSQLSTITPNGTSETFEYNHPDRLGTRLISNQTKGGSSEQATLPFGAALNAESTRTNNNKRFTSYDRSAATGLDYAVNRTYDSNQGRFTQVDPIKMSAASLTSPQTLNLYSYCGNDPINHTDSDGLFWGSLFRWIGKAFNFIQSILKWVAVAIAVVAVSLAVFASGGTALAFLGYIGGIFGKVIGKLGFIAIAQGGEISVGIGGKVFAGLYGVGAITGQQEKRRKQRRERRKETPQIVPLSGALLGAWQIAKDRISELLNDPNSDCYKFLKSKGFDPTAVAGSLKNQTPYDLAKSTNKEDFGAVAASPKELFDQYRKNNFPLDATTAPSGNIYYGNVRGGLRTSVVLHENLHKNYPTLSEDALGQQLGTWGSQTGADGNLEDSGKINDTLEKGGCK